MLTDTWPETALRRVRELLDPWAAEGETASTAVKQTTSPETALREVLDLEAKGEARVLDPTIATDAVSPVTWPETAPTLQLRECRAPEVETASVAASSDISQEIALTARLPLREDPRDRETASNAVSPVTLPESAESKLGEAREKRSLFRIEEM